MFSKSMNPKVKSPYRKYVSEYNFPEFNSTVHKKVKDYIRWAS